MALTLYTIDFPLRDGGNSWSSPTSLILPKVLTSSQFQTAVHIKCHRADTRNPGASPRAAGLVDAAPAAPAAPVTPPAAAPAAASPAAALVAASSAAAAPPSRRAQQVVELAGAAGAALALGGGAAPILLKTSPVEEAEI